ncbi:MAG: hypothetical protein ACTSUQ_07765 [Candidatus Freyarchaeota archaeon]
MVREYPWYDIVNGEEEIMQADFISDCPIVVPPLEVSEKVNFEIINYDVVVMSQSCDLVQRKIDLVLVCPVWPLGEFEKRSDFFRSKKGKEALRQGNVPGYHLLNKCDLKGFESDYMVVDFRSVYSVPFDFLIKLTKTRGRRLRLLPPYREHLSQAFARFFMRVGLPIDIPAFR